MRCAGCGLVRAEFACWSCLVRLPERLRAELYSAQVRHSRRGDRARSMRAAQRRALAWWWAHPRTAPAHRVRDEVTGRFKRREAVA